LGGIRLFLILVAIVLVIYIPVDLIPVWRKKQWALFWFYLVITAFSVVLSICILLKITLPSPVIVLKKVITAILGIE